MIEAHGLTKRYGPTTAVDDLSFEVLPGRVTGFLGPNGAGKSTTLRMVMGLDAPTKGTVTINGRPYASLPEPAAGGGLDAGGRRPPRGPLGPQPPAVRGAEQRHRPPPGRRGPRHGRPDHRGQAPGRQVLHGHGPTARDRRRPPGRPGAADLRRAGQRSRPRGHRVDPHPDAVPGGRGTDRVRLQPPDGRDGPDRRPRDRDRQGSPAGRGQRRRPHSQQRPELRPGPLRAERAAGRAARRPRRVEPRRGRRRPGRHRHVGRGHRRPGRRAEHRPPRALAPGRVAGRGLPGPDPRQRRIPGRRTPRRKKVA